MKTNEYRYILASNKVSKLDCPYCGAKKHWQRYVDIETDEVLPERYGRCDNENKCGKWVSPYNSDGYKRLNSEPTWNYTPKPQPSPRPVNYIDADTFNKSLTGYDKNNLVKYLHSLFDAETVRHLINIYKIGTSVRYGGGSTIFWQIDTWGNVRTGKIIKYDNNGHRIHGKQNWVHSVMKIPDFNLKQCLFGEHIVKHAPDATIGIVESEKTAIIATVVLPDHIWLATGGVDNLNKEKVKPLAGRKVILFPDASIDGRIFNKWKQKADEFGFECSDYLEKHTTENQKALGVDIADFMK